MAPGARCGTRRERAGTAPDGRGERERSVQGGVQGECAIHEPPGRARRLGKQL